MNYKRWFRLRAQSEHDVARDIDEELEAHVHLRSDDLERAGTPADRARREAMGRFGDYGEARRVLIESARQRRGTRRRAELLDELRQDFAYALRRARHAPAHSLFTIAVLAGGIGLTTGTFTVVNDVLIRALPFAQPDRIYSLTTLDSAGNPVPTVSISNWVDWKQQSQTLESSALYRTFRTPVISGTEALRSTVTQTAGDYFSVLATPMRVGRAYTDAETLAGDGGAVVSESFWRSVLGARSLPIAITIGSRTKAVTGVVRRGYEFPRGTDIWMGEQYRAMGGMYRNFINYEAIARLKPDVVVVNADQELDAISLRIHQQDPAALYSYGVTLNPLKDKIVGNAAVYLPIVLAAVLCVLLMGCANLAGLNLARGRARLREMAVRAALGAGKARLLRQLLVEHVVLALIAGAIGLAFASVLVRAAIAYAGSVLPRADEIAIDPGIALVALGVSVVCGVLTGILPAFQLSRSALRDRLTGARGNVTGGKQLPGALLVGVEIAAAVLLLTGGMLLLRSYRVLLDRDLGFDTNVIAADVVLSNTRYPAAAQKVGYWDRLTSELRSLPGIDAVGAANWIPLGIGAMSFIEVEGNPLPNSGAGYRAVGDDYFRALGVPLLNGRAIERRDDLGTARVAVINRAMAERFWPDQDPIGRRVRAPVMEAGPNLSAPPWITVVGVVGDLRHWGIESDPTPELYVAYRQVPVHALSMTAIVRTRVPIDQTIAAVRQRMRQIDPQTPADLGTLQQRLDDSLRVRQLITSVLSIFGVLALSLAAMGLYSLLAFAVAQRSREIAVRLALGARQNTLIRLVFGNAMAIAITGVIAGLLIATAVTRFLSSLLVEVRPLDPTTITVVPIFLLVVAALAAWIPARRAARVNPLSVLNRE
ncbi:MAG: ABC transporter permease [Gemmatimonadota bacterium]